MKAKNYYIVHPHYIILFLLLASISALFLGFTGAYLYNRIQQNVPPVQIPTLFYYNTLLLIACSYALIKAKKFYLDDDTEKYKTALLTTIILTLIFLGGQTLAWNQLLEVNIGLTHSTMASYLFLISGLHFAHVILGIPFLIYFYIIAVTKMKTPISVLIYFSDPDRQRSLNLLNIYWHFLDGLWIYLILFFIINQIIA